MNKSYMSSALSLVLLATGTARLDAMGSMFARLSNMFAKHAFPAAQSSLGRKAVAGVGILGVVGAYSSNVNLSETLVASTKKKVTLFPYCEKPDTVEVASLNWIHRCHAQKGTCLTQIHVPMSIARYSQEIERFPNCLGFSEVETEELSWQLDVERAIQDLQLAHDSLKLYRCTAGSKGRIYRPAYSSHFEYLNGAEVPDGRRARNHVADFLNRFHIRSHSNTGVVASNEQLLHETDWAKAHAVSPQQQSAVPVIVDDVVSLETVQSSIALAKKALESAK